MQKNKEMKKRNYFLSTLLVIFLVGILLAVAGLCSGGSLISYQVEQNENENGEMISGTTTLSDTEAQSIIGLDFNFKASSAKIINGNHYSIESSGHYKSSVKDGIWHVETTYPKAKLTFLARKIEIPAFWNGWGDDEEEFIITIPSNNDLTTADIQLAAGELNGDSLCADTVSFKIGAGELDFKELNAKDCKIKVGAGEAAFQEYLIEESCDIKVGAGEIEFGSEDVILSENVITDLKGECAAGEIYIAGKLIGDTDLDCATGEIDLLLDGSRSNYNINTSGAMSEINVDDSSDKNVQSDFEENKKEQYADISLDCSLGEINVKFEE